MKLKKPYTDRWKDRRGEHWTVVWGIREIIHVNWTDEQIGASIIIRRRR